ncbi:MarR family transcriptional regulator, partial [Streptomyces sp. NPDC087307]|uniref:helix-turn-helix transcriptional regulator n=1 Tax=Streptomyces sp. NPDC087307 TaxID=3365782 RepID=UPI0037F20972
PTLIHDLERVTVDVKEAWSKTAGKTKLAWRASATGAVNVADALSFVCAPLAARWDMAADRRNKLRTPENLKALMDAQKAHNSARALAARAKSERTRARAGSRNPLATARRAARVADKAARKGRDETRSALKAARLNYPSTLGASAIRWHAAHALPTAGLSYAWSSSADWTTWPTLTSAAVVAANVTGLWLGRRSVAVTVDDDGLTADERGLMERLDPAHWVEHAGDRGLAGTVTTPPQMTPAGIVCGVRLDGKWTVSEFKGKEESIRAVLGMKTETRMEIGKGSQGDWARIVVRTRSASDGMSMLWTPEHTALGVDEVTGDLVDIPLKPGVHVLLAGITGMGKSVSWRGLFLKAMADPEWTAVVLDPKRQEAIGVQHAVRAVGQEPNREQRMADIYGLILELTREMHRRQGIATSATWTPDGKPENRFLLVIVDEGAAIIRMAKEPRYKDVLDLLDELWGEARAAGFQFVWATQNPTKQGGIPALVKDNMSVRISLTTGAGEHERAVFGENAQATGWAPSTLGGIPGRAMIQDGKRRPDPVRMWNVPNDVMASLPKAEPWRSPAGTPVPGPDGGKNGKRLALVKTAAEEVPAPRAEEAAAAPAGAPTNRDRVLDAVRSAAGPLAQKDIAEATGIDKGAVSRAVTALVKAGEIAKTKAGIVIAGKEASA